MAKRKPPKLPGGGKKYANVQAAVNRHELIYQRHFARQFVLDAAVLAAHDVFGAGEKRMYDFYASMHEWLQKISEMILEDAQDDKEIVYSKDKLDEALKPLLGQNFRPYDERYRV